MNENLNLAQMASLISDPSRSAILLALFDGRPHPASELAYMARIKPQTASFHLQKLVQGGLLAVESYGRHRYYKLANVTVAQVVESLLFISPPPQVRSLKQSEEMKRLREARTCYDHFAGRLGVGLTNAMCQQGWLDENVGSEFLLTDSGYAALLRFGIDPSKLQERRSFAKKCLDWSERQHHLGGALGCALTKRLFDLNWVEQTSIRRVVRVTVEGKEGLQSFFHFHYEDEGA